MLPHRPLRHLHPVRPVRLRVLLAATAVGGLALTGVSPTPAAHAVVPVTEGALSLDGSISYDTAACTGTVEPSPVEAAFAAGSTVSRTLSFDTTATNTLDATDSVRFRGTQKLSVAATGSSQLSTLTATSTVTGSTTATKADSACKPDTFPAVTQNQGGVSAVIHRTTPGWLHVQASSVGTGGQLVAGEISDNVDNALFVTFGGFALRDLSHDQWVYVPAGSYEVELGMGGASALGLGIPTASVKSTIRLSFSPAGVAKGATTGTARAKVLFPNVLTCATGRATVRLTARINGASRASLYVNGVRKTTIVRPRARTLTLTGVPKTRAVTLKLVVVDHGRTLTATRSYRSC